MQLEQQGYGMGGKIGYIPALIGGKTIHVSPHGKVAMPTELNISRWKGWWKLLNIDQWFIFYGGAMAGMFLPGILYVAVIPKGTTLPAWGIAASSASGLITQLGSFGWFLALFFGFWIMYSTIFILSVGLVAGLASRNPHCGAMAAATGFLGCTWLGAYMTPDVLTIFLNAQIASVELTNLTSSLMISQLLGGGAGAILSAVMGAIGGALMEQRRDAHRESLGIVNPQVNGRPRLRITPALLTANASRGDEAMPRSGHHARDVVFLFSGQVP
jgi:hypothetical protein